VTRGLGASCEIVLSLHRKGNAMSTPTGTEKSREVRYDPAAHRRVLMFLNGAAIPEDLMFERPFALEEGDPVHEDDPEDRRAARPTLILERDIATRLLLSRDQQYPLGFRNVAEIQKLDGILDEHIERLFRHFSHLWYGSWSAFPQPIPRRGPGTYAGVVHAALLHTGQVLFITADETTLLWDPDDTTPATFQDPINQPGYSQLCGHHVFLSDGQLLSVGGGGYGPNPVARWGYKFDPVATSWSSTATPMSESKWYPTAVALDDERVLITCGNTLGHMEIYDKATDSFTPVVSGDDRGFPNLYPGLHVLPSHVVFYSRTGWGGAGAGGTATPDSTSAYFAPTGPNTGVWTNIAPALVNRAKGMSVLLHASTPPYLRILVIGGVDSATNNTYELIDATVLSSASSWGAPVAFPDGQHRSLCSAVLLPDGKVFVSGGIQSPNSPCTLFDPQTDTWSPMAALPSVRDYHSVSLLLPSGQVMMAGWNNSTIEIFNPPYMFSPRPVISAAPPLVHHGQNFTISSPDAASIVNTVLVRPMAVTHQTDSEQRVLVMPYRHDHAHPTDLTLTAPHGGHPHALAPQGYYMLFAINNTGVPSEGRWIYLH
jgi:WD40 repeat protein